MDGVRLLGSGLDTQGFTLDVDTADFPCGRFDEELSKMQDAKERRGWMYEFAGEWWSLQAWKSGGYYVFDYDKKLRVSINPKMKYSPVKVQVNSLGIHVHGGHDALHLVVAEMLAALGVGFNSALKIYRQDANWDYVVPSVCLSPENVYSPGRRIRPVMDDELGVQTLGVGERGKAHAYLRIYDKILEMENNGTFWQKKVLEDRGWREGESVLRVELELGGRYLKEFGLNIWDGDFRDGVCRIMKKLVRESFRMVEPFRRGSSASGLRRGLVNLKIWDLLCADLEKKTDGVASRVKIYVHGDARGRSRERLIEDALAYKVWCLEDGIAPELINSDMNFIDALTNDHNLLEAKRRRLGRSRKVYKLGDGRTVGGGNGSG